MIPAAMVKLNKTNATLSLPSGQQAVAGKGTVTGSGAVHVKCFLGLVAQINQIRDADLHFESHFVLRNPRRDLRVVDQSVAQSIQSVDGVDDFVVFENSGYGFDGQIFVSVELSTGKRNWKGGRYGKGQVLLLRESELLLVTSEKGELILLKATAEPIFWDYLRLNQSLWFAVSLVGLCVYATLGSPKLLQDAEE